MQATSPLPSRAAARRRPLNAALLLVGVLATANSRDLHAQPVAADVPPAATLEAFLPHEASGLRAADVAAAVAGRLPDVRVAERSLQQAELQIQLARTSLLPRIDLSASYTRLSPIEQPPFSFGGQSIDSPFPQILNNYGFYGTLTVPVSDIFLRAMPAFRAVQASAVVAELQGDAAREAAAWQGAEAYWGWLRASATRNSAAESVRLVEAATNHVEILAEAGVVPRLDVATARAGLEQARTGLAQAELGVALAAESIRILAGWEGEISDGIGEDVLAQDLAPPPAHLTIVDRALESRAEARMLRELRDLRERQIGIQQAVSLPTFQISAGGQYTNPNQRFVPASEEFRFTWDIGASVAWSPNDWRRNRVDVDRAELDVLRVDDDLEAFRLGVQSEAAQAISAWEQALVVIAGARVQIDVATVEYDARRLALRAGLGTTTELLDSLHALTSAQLQYVDGHIALRRAQAWVDRIQGTALLDDAP